MGFRTPSVLTITENPEELLFPLLFPGSYLLIFTVLEIISSSKITMTNPLHVKTNNIKK